ncbi:MAG TPA: arginine deiminase family protein [Bacillota bacterium]
MAYVKDSWSKLERVLLCPPDYFSFQPINVITRAAMERGEKAKLDEFNKEWHEFIQAYESAGVKVETVDPQRDLPYMIYARDFGACLAEGALIGSFREPVRQGEEHWYVQRLHELQIPIIGRITRGSLEGGDFWFLDESTIAWGVIARSTSEGVQNAAEILRPYGYEVIPVHSPSRNLHLDMCFNIVADKVAVLAPDALPEWFLKMLRKRHFELVPVPQEGVFKHYCNIQALGNGRVLTFEANKDVNQSLKALGLEVMTSHLVEILKGGGGPHCMTFPLKRAD